MDLKNFCDSIGFNVSAMEILKPNWDKFIQNSSGEFPFFMEREFYSEYYPLCQGPDGVMERMDIVADTVRQNPLLARYANIMHYAIFRAVPAIDLGKMPDMSEQFGENAGIFHLLVCMSSLPLIAETHKKMGIPESFMPAAAKWIGGTIGIYAAAHNGIPGHSRNQTFWMRFHVDGQLFRIGRLEFLNGVFLERMPAVFRRKSDGELVLFCRNNWKFDAKGNCLQEVNEAPAFVASLSIMDGKVTGTCLDEYGKPETEKETTILLDEYEEFISAWDMIPSIHIPGGGGMTMEAVNDSLIKAKEFYRNYFRMDVKAFICSSWLLNSYWRKALPNSNMAKLQLAFRLGAELRYPCTQGKFFVYGDEGCDPRKMPCTTSLHRAFCKAADDGEYLTAGTILVTAKDIENLEKQQNNQA